MTPAIKVIIPKTITATRSEKEDKQLSESSGRAAKNIVQADLSQLFPSRTCCVTLSHVEGTRSKVNASVSYGQQTLNCKSHARASQMILDLMGEVLSFMSRFSIATQNLPARVYS